MDEIETLKQEIERMKGMQLMIDRIREIDAEVARIDAEIERVMWSE